MTTQIDRRTFVISVAALAAASGTAAFAQEAAETNMIEMLNQDPDNRRRRMVYKPLVTVVNAGDTVKWMPTDRGHNTVSIEGMLPEGAEEWKSKLNDEFEYTFAQPGVYGYLCQPHSSLGMVGLVIVRGEGMMDNVEAARAVKHRGRTAKVFEEIWALVDEENLLEQSA
ncbi:MAG: pseudoazurin [Pseudomonadota bacterium]